MPRDPKPSAAPAPRSSAKKAASKAPQSRSKGPKAKSSRKSAKSKSDDNESTDSDSDSEKRGKAAPKSKLQRGVDDQKPVVNVSFDGLETMCVLAGSSFAA